MSHGAQHATPDDEAFFSDESEPSPGHGFQADRPPKPRRNLARVLASVLMVLAFVCAAMGVIAASGYAGLQAGNDELRARGTATASAILSLNFQRGIDLLNQGDYPLAQAYLEDVFRRNPTNIGVRDLIVTAQFLQTPTPTPTATPPARVTTDKAALLTEMDAAVAAKNWDRVVALTDQLRALDVAYERERVTGARYTALRTRGLGRLEEGQIEAGLLDLDFAAALRPLDAFSESQRRVAAQYQNALNYFGANWDRAIALFSEVYRTSPNYRDVRARLYQSYVNGGDAFAAQQNWCPAQERYAGALAVTANAQVEQKRADAAARCALATPVPITGTNGAAVSVSGVPGRLAFSVFDGASYQLSMFSAAAGRVLPIAAGGAQPSFGPAGNVLAYVAGNTMRGYGRAGNFVTLRDGPGFWPSLSPDGRRLAYAQVDGAGYAIFVAPLDGSAPPARIASGTFPAWGPTGRIAFQGCTNFGCGIHVVNPDNPAELQRMTESAADINPAWSPNGQEIAYVSNVTGNWEVYAFNMARAFRRITSNGALATAPAWSPDGSQIAYQANRDGSWAIYIVPAGGGDARKVFELGPQHPQWQSDRMAWSP